LLELGNRIQKIRSRKKTHTNLSISIFANLIYNQGNVNEKKN